MTNTKNLYYNKSLKELARELLKNSTKSEIRLWAELLRAKGTGYIFLRQRPVLTYIADFLCKELESEGFKIIRFTDDEVIDDIHNVESEIMYWIEKRSE